MKSLIPRLQKKIYSAYNWAATPTLQQRETDLAYFNTVKGTKYIIKKKT